jgi:response regulator RpfG family c-di-GMP phosphodiesterase
MKKRVMFVDDEPSVLQGLERNLRTYKSDWEMQFVESGHDALNALDKEPADAVVVDLRMPIMGGERLLTEVKKKFPKTARIVLTGVADRQVAVRLRALTHGYLVKPCEPEMLMSMVNIHVNLARSAVPDPMKYERTPVPPIGDRQQMDLNVVLEKAISLTRSEWEDVAEMETKFDLTLPMIPCIPTKIVSLLVNMIVNSAHAIAEDEDRPNSQKGVIQVSTKLSGPWVEIRISDTSTPIPQAVRAQLSAPSSQAELLAASFPWLAIAHSTVVEAHNGILNVEAKGMRGATFVMRLPRGA